MKNELKEPFDITKKFTTRDGLQVKIYSTDASHLAPFRGETIMGEVAGRNSISFWKPNGRFSHDNSDHPLDLVNTPEYATVTFWVNVYVSILIGLHFVGGTTYKSERDAIRAAHQEGWYIGGENQGCRWLGAKEIISRIRI